MYVAFPRSEYYDSSDFSKPSLHPRVSDLGLGTALDLDVAEGGVFEIAPVNSYDLFTHARHLDPAGSEQPCVDG